MHIGAFENLQKSQLKLLWLHGIDIVEGSAKGVIILKGQTRDQVQMLMHIFSGIDPLNHIAQPVQIHLAPDCLNRIRIGTLHANLQLDQPRPHPADQVQLFLIQKICRNLKMKVGDTVVMLQNMLPDCHGMTLFRIKRTVHKLNLRHLLFQEKVQFRKHQLQIPETNRLINGGETVAAGKRTSAAAFIINNAVFKSF